MKLKILVITNALLFSNLSAAQPNFEETSAWIKDKMYTPYIYSNTDYKRKNTSFNVVSLDISECYIEHKVSYRKTSDYSDKIKTGSRSAKAPISDIKRFWFMDDLKRANWDAYPAIIFELNSSLVKTIEVDEYQGETEVEEYFSDDIRLFHVDRGGERNIKERLTKAFNRLIVLAKQNPKCQPEKEAF